MTFKYPDGTTVGQSEPGTGVRSREGSPAPAVLPALTVLYHPDLERIGERVFLNELAGGGEAFLSRTAPELARPDRFAGEPLGDPHLSRRPIRFRGADGGIEIEVGESRTAVVADGLNLHRRAVFSAGQVSRGVVLELAGTVVLLLHRIPCPASPAPPRCGLIGDNPEMLAVREDVRRVADLEVPVLLRGETGTGKELVARAIHDAGPRRSAPFVGVNLGAIPASLSASQLFGAVKGAFTGSVASQEGYFRHAHGGTLFLDEIGEAPAEVQVMLLRALETGEVYPVGSASPLRVDVRILAATDSDLGDFRAPLLHRLAGFDIRLPPLRERRDDVGRLLIHFLRHELGKIGEGSRLENPRWLPPSLVARLARYDWPGNVRQLRNVVRQLMIASRGRAELDGFRLERLLREEPATPPSPPPPVRRKPGEVSEDEILEALRASRWDLKAAADRLRISRPSLYNRIESSSRIRKVSDLSTEEIAKCHGDCRGDLDPMSERLEVSRRALGRRVRELKLE
ncbi:MAG TPA: sigma 54-interacting transcriptional regulator [Thermoanaerobaculia bacterium]|nr:sigma 54-interacting transcriptional regulator [Thermoanaerobaculia bacterium]